MKRTTLMTWVTGLCALGAACVFLPQVALGDGGMIPPYGKDIWEPSQKALILYDDAEQMEDLVLHVEFEGDTRDFGWIVPVPSLPTLGEASQYIFWDCAYLTKPVVKERRGVGCSANQPLSPGAWGEDSDGRVDIYDHQIVGMFETLTVGADDATALVHVLEEWGFLHGGNRRLVEEALQFYIDKSWYFVAMKIDPSTPLARNSRRLYQGAIDPIRLTFQSSHIVYPMRISALSATDPCEVLLYVCAPHRVTYAKAKTQYAHRIRAGELPDLRSRYPHLFDVITEPCFMTKLRRTFRLHDMTDDVIIVRAFADLEFREVQYVGLPFSEMLFVGMVGVVLVSSRIARRLRMGEWANGRRTQDQNPQILLRDMMNR